MHIGTQSLEYGYDVVDRYGFHIPHHILTLSFLRFVPSSIIRRARACVWVCVFCVIGFISIGVNVWECNQRFSEIKIHHYQLTRWDLYVIIFFLSHIQPTNRSDVYSFVRSFRSWAFLCAFFFLFWAGTWQRCGLKWQCQLNAITSWKPTYLNRKMTTFPPLNSFSIRN